MIIALLEGDAAKVADLVAVGGAQLSAAHNVSGTLPRLVSQGGVLMWVSSCQSARSGTQHPHSQDVAPPPRHCDLGTAMLTLDSVSMKDIFCRRAVAIVSVLIILVSNFQSGNQVFVARGEEVGGGRRLSQCRSWLVLKLVLRTLQRPARGGLVEKRHKETLAMFAGH